MANYMIKKSDHTDEIICMEYELDGYHINPRMHSGSGINIKDITVIEPKMIEYALENKFKKNYQKLLAIFFEVINNDDATDEGVMIVLDEVARLKSIFFHKYERFLSREKEKFFHDKLMLLETELKFKLLNMHQMKFEEDLEERRIR